MAYIGSAEDARRIRKQQEQREKEKKDFEEKKKQAGAGAGLRQFGAGTTEVLEAHFKEETVGLVTREEFLNKRNTLKDRLEEEKQHKKRQAEAETAAAKAQRQMKKARLESKAKLSFVEEEQEEDMQEEVKAPKMGKDPHVDTEFLPDRDHAKKEEDLRKQIQEEYELRQKILQGEPLAITYSFYDGNSGHRRDITVKRGDSIGEFLKQVRTQLAPEFKAIRNVSISNLLYVKEDLILPHAVTFHDLIRKKARGKSGPLFHFDVHDDVRLEHDARLEKNESHAGKVVERSWYQRNKHVFPASRWEEFDPNKAMHNYTIK